MTTDRIDLDDLAKGGGQRLYARARSLIPGGTQLLSKRPEMFSADFWPAYFRAARGVTVEDVDGRRFRDMGYHGIGACALGYGRREVDEAVKAAIDRGVASTLNAPEEPALAERLIGLHPWADMARFARSGGEIMAIAARIARAATGRDRIAVCGYHGWQDWYLAANLTGGADGLKDHLLPGLDPRGLPPGLAGTILPFGYNRFDEMRAAVAAGGDRLAAIILEPTRAEPPAPGFLAEARALADRAGAVLVFDEITSGFRISTGGAHLTLGVAPDLAAFAKALGNGYAISALIGRRAVMDAAQDSFISSTAWTERLGPAAALATLDVFERENAPARLIAAGEQVRTIWREAAAAAGLPIAVRGLPPLSTFAFLDPHAQAMKTYFVEAMLEAGFLATTAFYATTAHEARDLADYGEAAGAIFAHIGAARARGTVETLPRGRLAQSGFARLA